jgi:hypothetical protein
LLRITVDPGQEGVHDGPDGALIEDLLRRCPVEGTVM